jgi:hypothetical protein
MEAQITIKNGCPPEVARQISTSTPIRNPDHWVTRKEAGDELQVNERTIDRYIRHGDLSAYAGPVTDRPGTQSGYGVRVWRDDVVAFHEHHTITVVGDPTAGQEG